MDAESARESYERHAVAAWARHPSATAIMQTLLDAAEPVGVSTLCERADISRQTWYDVRGLLVDEFGMVEEVGEVEDRPRYQARPESDAVRAFHRFARELAHARTRQSDSAGQAQASSSTSPQ